MRQVGDSGRLIDRWNRWYAQRERFVLGAAGFVFVVVVWELVVRLGLAKQALISSPSQVVAAAQVELQQGRIWGDIAVSAQEYVFGLVAASVLGIVIGLLAGWFKRVNYVVDPWLSALYATPDVALIPLFILWLGLGLWTKVFVVFMTSLFSVAVNTLVGVQSTEVRLLDVAESFGASRYRVFTTVVLPGAVPFILTGLRLAAGRALVGMVLAELIAANQGIGFMISIAGATLNTGRLMLGVLLLGALGVVLGEGLRHIEQRFDVWRPQIRED